MTTVMTSSGSPPSPSRAKSAPTIRPIEKSAIHRICSNQVIVDLSTAVKELVENSLDSSATQVTISLQQYGARMIEVNDNGSGITPENYHSLALKHWTSKLSEFSDLGTVRSFGFRGEALSSLCALGQLQVCTRCANEQVATLLTYNHDGVLVEQKPASRLVGTTVTLSNLFSTLPVRHKVFLQHLKTEYSKMLNVLQSYAMICRGVRIQVYNTVLKDAAKSTSLTTSSPTLNNSGSRTLILGTQGSSEMKELIGNIFGAKQIAALQEVNATLQSTEEFKLKDYFATPTIASSSVDPLVPSTTSPSADSSTTSNSTSVPAAASSSTTVTQSSSSIALSYQIVGFISKLDSKCGRSAADRQYLYVNNRPVDLPRLTKLINEAYRSCNAQTSYPVFILNLLLPPQSYDVNLTPNKREIMVHDDTAVFGLIRSLFTRMFEPSMYTYRVKDLSEFGIRSQPSLSQPEDSPFDHDYDSDLSPSPPAASLQSPSLSLDESTLEMSRFLSPDQKQSPSLKSPHVPYSPVPTALNSLRTPFSSLSPSLPNSKRATPSPPSPILASRNKELVSPLSTATSKLIPMEIEVRTPSKPNPSLAPALLRYQSTPIASPIKTPSPSPPAPVSSTSTASPGIRSISSFFGSRTPTSIPKLESASLESMSSSPGLFIDEEGRLSKRQRTEEHSLSTSPPVAPSFSRQTTTLLPTTSTSSPIDLCTPSPDSSSASPLPPLEATQQYDEDQDAEMTNEPTLAVTSIDDDLSMFDETDMNVHYGTHAVQRKIDLDFSSLEQFYSNPAQLNSLIHSHSTVTDAASLFHRVSSVLSPSGTSAASATSSSSTTSNSLGGELSAAPILNEESMRRVIEKDDFLQMEIIGQFNLGFIIARKDADLFIIDQHATDEKYRFETLQSTTIINSQPLLNPLPLELSPAMEITVKEHLDIFRKNGFEIEIKEYEAELEQGDTHHPLNHHKRIRVKSLPFSKNITFGADDIHELCALLHESPGHLVRLPKVTSMFASRACRSSVMIGTPLTHTKMSTIVKHMSTMDHPWACPHGRPTMRHLFDLSLLRTLASNTGAAPTTVKPLQFRPSYQPSQMEEEEVLPSSTTASPTVPVIARISCCQHD